TARRGCPSDERDFATDGLGDKADATAWSASQAASPDGDWPGTELSRDFRPPSTVRILRQEPSHLSQCANRIGGRHVSMHLLHQAVEEVFPFLVWCPRSI